MGATQPSSDNLIFKPFDPEFRVNPYPAYPGMLEGPPRSLNLFVPTTVVARYDHVVEVLHDSARFSTRRPEIPARQRIDVFGGAPTVLTSDPPIHTRLRKLVSNAFTPRRVRELEPRIRAIAAGLVDRIVAKGTFEAMADLANPLPVIVIAELLGVSSDHHEHFKRWSNALISASPDAMGDIPPEANAARDALRAYFAEEIEKRRVSPSDDLVGALVTARDEAGALSEDELLAFVILLLLAGNETTTNLIGNGLLTLCRHPEQLERLRQNPDLIESAIEEILRFDPPVQMTVRTAERDTSVGGTDIARNGFLFVLLAAANRDRRQFPNPERFDITRHPNEHLSFGEGIHFCLGAPLARLEGAIAIGTVIERCARLRLADPGTKLSYRGSLALRGLVSLPLAFD